MAFLIYLMSVAVVEKLDAMPERFCRQIRAIKPNGIEKAVKELKADMPHDYMAAMIEKAAGIDAGIETLILSEELKSEE